MAGDPAQDSSRNSTRRLRQVLRWIPERDRVAHPFEDDGRACRMRRPPLNLPPNTLSQTYPRPLTLPHTPTGPAAACKGAKLLAWSFACGRESAGPPAISARLEIPAGRDRTTLAWCRGSTPAPTRDAREDGGFTARKMVRRLSGC